MEHTCVSSSSITNAKARRGQRVGIQREAYVGNRGEKMRRTVGAVVSWRQPDSKLPWDLVSACESIYENHAEMQEKTESKRTFAAAGTNVGCAASHEKLTARMTSVPVDNGQDQVFTKYNLQKNRLTGRLSYQLREECWIPLRMRETRWQQGLFSSLRFLQERTLLLPELRRLEPLSRYFAQHSSSMLGALRSESDQHEDFAAKVPGDLQPLTARIVRNKPIFRTLHSSQLLGEVKKTHRVDGCR